MKKLMLIPLFAILSGCVSYYYPEAETYLQVANDDVYLEEEVYIEEAASDYIGKSISYSNASYYPWWSLDYFYLGSHQHRSGFSIGFNYGYNSSWYDPYYSGYYPYSLGWYYPLRYSVWYSPFYDYGYNRYGWNDYYWRHRYNNHHRSYYRGYDRGGYDNADQYAGRDWNRGHNGGRAEQGNNGTVDFNRDHGSLRDESSFANSHRGVDRNRNRHNGEDGRLPRGAPVPGSRSGTSGHSEAVSRQVSHTPGRGNARRGMEVRSREARKPSATKMEPGKPEIRLSPAIRVVAGSSAARNTTAAARSTTARNHAPYTISNASSGEIRSYSGSKNRATRKEPIRSQPIRSQPIRIQATQPQVLRPQTSRTQLTRVPPRQQQYAPPQRKQRPGTQRPAPQQARTQRQETQRPSAMTQRSAALPQRVQRSVPQQRTAPPQRAQRPAPMPRQAPVRATPSKAKGSVKQSSSGNRNSAGRESRPQGRKRAKK